VIEVNFKKVIMENFCCYKDRMEYPFKNDIISLITGPNGIGKSTIFSAVPYTLYGITPTGLKGDDVVNNEVGKNCYTSLEFSINKDEYICDRYCKNSKLGNTAILTKNGTIIKKGHTEVVAEIERILMPQKLFFNTLLFGQKVKTFFTDLTDSEQKDIFRKVLLLDDYLLYYDESSKELKENKELLEKNLNNINIVISLKDSLADQIIQLEESKKSFYLDKKIEINSLKHEKSKVQNDIDENKKVLLSFGNSDLDSIYTRLSDHLSDLKNQSQNEKTNLSNIINQTESKKTEKENNASSKFELKKSNLNSEKDSKISQEKLNFKNDSKDLLIKLSSLNNNLENIKKDFQSKGKDYSKLNEDIEELKKNLSSGSIICPTCMQEVGKDNIIHFQNELKQKIEDFNSLKIVLEGLKNEGNILKDIIKLNEEKVELIEHSSSLKIEKLKKEYDDEIEELENDFKEYLSIIIENHNKEIKKINEENKDKIESLSKTISKVETEKDEIFKKIKDKNVILEKLRTLDSSLNNYKNLIESKENEKFDESVIEKNKLKFTELHSKYELLKNESEELTELINVYEFWKIGYSMSGIPSMLIDEAIPFMNEQIRFYLDQIGSRYIVAFDTLNKNKSGEFKDKIAVNIFDTVTKANMRKQLSGGQTRIVDIATILTLRDLQSNIQDMKSNIIILDEIFDSLDPKNIEYVSNILRQMINGNSINIISHTQIEQLEADEVLRFL